MFVKRYCQFYRDIGKIGLTTNWYISGLSTQAQAVKVINLMI